VQKRNLHEIWVQRAIGIVIRLTISGIIVDVLCCTCPTSVDVDCEACQKKGDEIGNNFEETRKDSISKSAIFFRNKKHKISTGVKCYEVGTYVKIIYVLKNTNTLHSCAVSRNSRKLL
jgi:hypothetical protein